ncbi:MAG: hypothetical protein PUE68_03130 [Kiritimatiellae bacterium]|nr:hypothetical protein [Kiritimatiellia bacterium]
MSGTHRYKFGGETTCRHYGCPARVLLGGHCTKACPERKRWLGGCSGPDYCMDHVGLETDAQGRLAFVSRLYYMPSDEDLVRLRKYCDAHGLDLLVEEKPFNGLPRAIWLWMTKK